jgi:poly(ADP-ribose) glycohydrolase ARH3
MRKEQVTGSILGAMLGDVIGAPVEGESPKYLAKRYRNLDQIIEQESVPEILGQRWMVGRYTDDTQMTLCVLEWLLEDWPADQGEKLLARFAEAYRPARRYGSGAARLLESWPEHRQEWKALATLQFPEGSYGNGSAMRVAPIGLALAHDPPALLRCARLSSQTTHAHRLAQVGACLQARAVALAATLPAPLDSKAFLEGLEDTLQRLERAGLQVQEYRQALATFPMETGVAALESVPSAIACFSKHPSSFENALHEAIFLGGDVDTVASMVGALSGAHLGLEALPKRWLSRVREEDYPPGRVLGLAERLWQKYWPTPQSCASASDARP